MIEGFVRLMGSEDGITGPVNLGNPGEFIIKELAEQILNLTGSNSKLEFKPLPDDDPQQRKPDIALAQSELGNVRSWLNEITPGVEFEPYFDRKADRGRAEYSTRRPANVGFGLSTPCRS